MPALLEREELLAQLDALQAEGGGRLVFVGGEAGVGKTSLVRAVAASVGAGALHGSCENLTTPTPFGPFLDSRHRRSTPTRADVARAVSARARARRHSSCSRTCTGPTRRRSTLYVCSGGASTRRRPSSSRPTATTRSAAGIRSASSSASSRLRPPSRGSRVPRLSLDAVRELADPYGADAEAIHRLTDGNAVLRHRGAGRRLGDAAARRYATQCSPGRRSLPAALGGCSTPCPSFPAESSSACSRRSRRPSSTHSARASQSGVLREAGDGVAFRHELARLAVESAVSPDRRRALHAGIVAHARAEPATSRAARPPRRGGRRLGGGAGVRPGGGSPRDSGERPSRGGRSVRARPSARRRAGSGGAGGALGRLRAGDRADRTAPGVDRGPARGDPPLPRAGRSPGRGRHAVAPHDPVHPRRPNGRRRGSEPRSDRDPREPAARPRPRDRLRGAGVRPHAVPRQRRGRRVGREGGGRRRSARRPRHPRVRPEHGRDVAHDGRPHRRRRRVPAPQPRDRADGRPRAADPVGARDARLGPRGDVRARPGRALPPRVHRVRGGPRAALLVRPCLARARGALQRPLGASPPTAPAGSWSSRSIRSAE